jgi:hypothetical protein
MSEASSYDIPDSVFGEGRSEAFRKFFHNWFKEPLGLIRHEVDTDFLIELSPEERDMAVDLLRRNLRLGYTHILEGVALLGDKDSVPVLKEMLAETTDPSRRLSITGSLWKLTKDQSFPEELERMVRKGYGTLKEAHFDQILWLGDRRSVIYLIDLLAEGQAFVGFLALARLNEIEDNKRYLLPRDDFPHQPGDYRDRKDNQSFIDSMVTKMNNYDPTDFVMRTSSGIVSDKID